MKDYERLTEKGKPKYCEKLKSGIANWEAILRLSNLEDKIESGEIDYVAEKDKEIARLTEENARLKKEKICLNIAEDNGVFVCSECKFDSLNDYRLKLNKGDKYYHYEYNIKYCPNCGAKVENQQ